MIVMELQLHFQSHGILDNQVEAEIKIVSCIGVHHKIILANWAMMYAVILNPQFVSNLYKKFGKVIGNECFLKIY